jgi:hypothetical protein
MQRFFFFLFRCFFNFSEIKVKLNKMAAYYLQIFRQFVQHCWCSPVRLEVWLGLRFVDDTLLQGSFSLGNIDICLNVIIGV